METQICFVHEKDTDWTHRYKECDASGNIKDRDEVVVGTLYVKQRHFRGRQRPDGLTLTVTEGLPQSVKRKTKRKAASRVRG